MMPLLGHNNSGCLFHICINNKQTVMPGQSVKQKLMKPSPTLPLHSDLAAVEPQHPLLPSLHPLTAMNNGAV